MSEWGKTDYVHYDWDGQEEKEGPPDASLFNKYEDFVKSQVDTIPDHLVVLLPYGGSNTVFKKIQLEWICDFWDSRKKLNS